MDEKNPFQIVLDQVISDLSVQGKFQGHRSGEDYLNQLEQSSLKLE